MGKPPGYSNGPYTSPEIDHEQDQLEHGASPHTAKWLYIVITVLCAILFALVMIGLHVPRGE